MSTIAVDARIISSGTGRYIRGLLQNLEGIDSDNIYLVLVRRKDLHYYQPKNPNFKVIEAEFADYSFGEQLGFNRLLRSLKPDLVHFCMPQQPLLYTRPAVTTVHDLNLLRITANDDMNWLELRIKKGIFAGLLWLVARRAKQIITPSEFSKKDLVAFSNISSDKVTVTLEGAEKADAEPKPIADLQGKRFIMYLGRAEPYKNNRGLILAHQELLATYPDLRLVIAGAIDKQRKADMKWVSDNAYKQVDFAGFISDEEAAWLYKNCLAYIVPSFMEGFGLPGLEAMGYGAPVISSNATCLPEIYKGGAYYFDPHKPGDMARAITDVFEDEGLRDHLSERGIQVHGSYSWRRMAEQTLVVYKQVLDQNI
ncbi:MAG TPA: glycosyltransferase family 1 protein [Candidatus Saccharimonadales bacterium]|nr:glycosyltransferase family 1 protein [Candidatus Saccharimonadales bacterium]